MSNPPYQDHLVENYWIHPEKPPVRVWSSIYVPWDNPSKEQKQLRRSVQDALAKDSMNPRRPVTRCAWLSGPKGGNGKNDPDNLLLYNMRIWKSMSLSQPAVRFYWDDGKSRNDERANMRKPPTECHLRDPMYHYRYWIEDEQGPAIKPPVFTRAFFSETVSVDRNTFTGHPDRYARRVWLAVSTALQNTRTLHSYVHKGPFGLRVTLSAGEEHAGKEYPVKQLLDGLMCALHWLPETCRCCATEYAARLEAEFRSVPFANIDAGTRRIEHLLFDERNKVLGAHKFINKNLQFGPADDLCEMGELRLRKHDDAQHLSVAIELFSDS